MNDIISAPEALDAAETGRAVLIDIRRPDEWLSTGLARPAIGITMEDPLFVDKVREALDGDSSRCLILICRTGVRTLRMMQLLRSLGFSRVHHVGEGMLGSSHGPGWLAHDLPVRRHQM